MYDAPHLAFLYPLHPLHLQRTGVGVGIGLGTAEEGAGVGRRRAGEVGGAMRVGVGEGG